VHSLLFPPPDLRSLHEVAIRRQASGSRSVTFYGRGQSPALEEDRFGEEDRFVVDGCNRTNPLVTPPSFDAALQGGFNRKETAERGTTRRGTQSPDDFAPDPFLGRFPSRSPRAFPAAFSCQLSCSPGPLAHPEEQGTFNPKVPGSRPGRPTESEVTGL
jgi:hypothetical protein